MNKPLLTDYDKDPFPNPNPKVFHGCWYHSPELHDQKSLNKEGVYLLQHKAKVPECGSPFFVGQTHPSDGGDARCTDNRAEAHTFRGAYLLDTMWEWELSFEAVPA